jgi:GNAT superfamily N-acetyltransferase
MRRRTQINSTRSIQHGACRQTTPTAPAYPGSKDVLSSMTPHSVPYIIREARADEYNPIGKLHASAFATDPTYHKRFEGLDAATILQWLWLGRAKSSVDQGFGNVLVVEHTGTKELVGVAWYWRMSERNPPRLPTYPAGGRQASLGHKSAPYIEWMKELVKLYGDIFCTYQGTQIANIESSSPVSLPSVLAEFAIAPQYQGQGLGTQLMLRLFGNAEQEGLNVALTPHPGKRPRVTGGISSCRMYGTIMHRQT